MAPHDEKQNRVLRAAVLLVIKVTTVGNLYRTSTVPVRQGRTKHNAETETQRENDTTQEVGEAARRRVDAREQPAVSPVH